MIILFKNVILNNCIPYICKGCNLFYIYFHPVSLHPPKPWPLQQYSILHFPLILGTEPITELNTYFTPFFHECKSFLECLSFTLVSFMLYSPISAKRFFSFSWPIWQKPQKLSLDTTDFKFYFKSNVLKHEHSFSLQCSVS